MNALELLEGALTLIEDPKNWTQHELARDANGSNIDVLNSNAVCFCTTVDEPVVGYNDASTHAEVVQMFKDTIARLKGGQ